MNQNIGGILGDIIPLVIFIYFGLILTGVVKSKKQIAFFISHPVLSKVLVFGGILVFTLLFVIRLFNPD